MSQTRQAVQAQNAPRATATVFLIYGGDDYLVTEAARRILHAVCPEAERAFGLDEVHGDATSVNDAAQALRQCLVAVQTSGFSQGKKVVWFRNVSFLKNALLLKNTAVQTWLTELTTLIRSGLPDGHRLLITAPSVDGRSAFFKACREAGEVQEYDLPTRAWQARKAAQDRSRDLFQKAGLTVPQPVLNSFLDRVGAETRTLASEIEKLSLYAGEQGTVTQEMIQDLVSVSQTSEGWDLAEAVADRNTGKALALVRRLLFQKVHWTVLMGGLESRFRELLVVREGIDRGWARKDGKVGVWEAPPDAAAILDKLDGKRDPRKWHPFRLGLLIDQARPFTVRGIEARRRLILEARERMVSGFTEPEILLEFLVLRLTGQTQTRGTTPAERSPA